MKNCNTKKNEANKNNRTTESKRSWWVLEFEVEAKDEDIAVWLMIHELGANGCQFISATKDRVTLQASFEPDKISADNLQPVYASLDEYGLGAIAANLRINKLLEADWLSEWKKGLKPIMLGEAFLVSPPWFEGKLSEEESKRRVIWIEPGLAFGTGFHATTQFCLQALETHLSTVEAGCEILDMGTGSGILAIAAAIMLPDAKIMALEIDPLACKIAAENFALNQVSNQVELLQGSTERILGRAFNAILSNLTCEDNIALLDDYLSILKPGGLMIMSGVLLEKAHLIEAELNKHPLKIVERQDKEIWSGFVVERTEENRLC